MLSSFVKPLYLSPLREPAGGAERCWGVIGACQGPCNWAHTHTPTHTHCAKLIETDAPSIWAFRESECMWQTVNQPVMRGNRTVDRSISYLLGRQTEEKQNCSPGKWFAFQRAFISLLLLVSLSFPFPPPPPLHSSTLRVYLSPPPLWIWLFWLFISAHFSSCPSHGEGDGDPADQGWVMAYERSLWAMRAPLGLIIYTGPGWEQAYVSQSHQRRSKAGLSMSTHTHKGRLQAFCRTHNVSCAGFDLLKGETHLFSLSLSDMWRSSQ